MPHAVARPARRRTRRTAAQLTLAAVSAGALVGALPGAALAVAVPPKPSYLPAGFEALQPYVGQTGCDPVAKPGVSAFASLLMNTYRDTGSLGIVRDCGIGGQSEHKEGRAFDWTVSVNNPNHVAEVKALTDWLTAPSSSGEPAVMARRFGIMYMIWNQRVWKAYQPERGWQTYTGPNPHVDHVHFSFGWNGAKKATSWWSGRVAPIDYGPYVKSPTPPPAPSVVPAASPANLKLLATYGGTTLQRGSSGAAVQVMQTGLKIEPADGYFGPVTEGKVKDFQTAYRLPVTGVFGPTEWQVLFPRPVNPFGTFETVSPTAVTGWVADADTSSPISVQVLVDKVPVAKGVAGLDRPDIAANYPGIGTAHGYRIPVRLTPGTHSVCVVGVNVGAGADTSTGCASLLVQPASPLTATALPTGVTDLFAREDTGAASVRTVRSGQVGAARSLGGRIVGAPAGVLRTSTTEEAYVRGTNDVLYTARRAADGTYGAWQNLGSTITSRPAVSARGTGQVDLVARSSSGSLLHRTSTAAGSWSAEKSLGGALLPGTAPAAAWTRSGRLHVFIVDTDRTIRQRSMDSRGTWSRWQSLGGATTSDLTAVATGYDEVSVAVRGTNDRGYVRTLTGTGSGGTWTSLGGLLESAPGIAAVPGSRTAEVFGTGTDRLLYRNARVAGVWTGWVRQS